MNTTTTQSPVDGSVLLDLGERKLSLALNGRAARLILEHLGIDIYREFSRLQTVNAGQWNTLVWALCQNKQNGEAEAAWPTLADVEEWLSMDNMAEVVEAAFLALAPRAHREKLKNEIREVRKQMENVIGFAFSTSEPSPESTSESTPESSTTSPSGS